MEKLIEERPIFREFLILHSGRDGISWKIGEEVGKAEKHPFKFCHIA